jgi:catechol 2,3-dioxygenase-like lactoylglutathione lyase family enzyme
MQLKIMSVMVEDQCRAREFYTQKLGFVIKNDIPMGEFVWLTLVSPDGPGDIELLLEPTNFPPSRTYQAALKQAGIAAAGFYVANVEEEVARLRSLGVEITTEPAPMGSATVAAFDDTCGNIIQIYHTQD